MPFTPPMMGIQTAEHHFLSRAHRLVSAFTNLQQKTHSDILYHNTDTVRCISYHIKTI